MYYGYVNLITNYTIMKNALSSGLIIGILSLVWLLVMHWLGYNSVKDNNLAPYEYFSVLIPLIGLFLGLRAYREKEQGGKMSFLEGLIQGFKILLVGGVIAGFIGVIYINWFSPSNLNFSDFSGRIFGALLVGILFDIVVSLILMNRSTHL
ncbi:DUF4199 domain-containing protein [Mucilaginibacter sp. RS28]|uniref:DUF4199 domain-containing protein n=1 Tax=Mucilaginibacter straminoryzae TaxID=2932774 RepID=A0A9X1X6B9_9SPHI|nr:DUF4199 domain-containing protein [Mucilaginibacter straminoryzae]MCJ8211733.1 DUF4199 domain-containing protein [Mucilaginibacter straminoryzae]